MNKIKAKYIIRPEGQPCDVLYINFFGYQYQFYLLHIDMWVWTEWWTRKTEDMIQLRTPIFAFKAVKIKD